ncbi:MAG: hypothetical protein WC761_07065 [Candidatus Paceibacterota bacterium]|jgi:hypothetical protein
MKTLLLVFLVVLIITGTVSAFEPSYLRWSETNTILVTSKQVTIGEPWEDGSFVVETDVHYVRTTGTLVFFGSHCIYTEPAYYTGRVTCYEYCAPDGTVIDTKFDEAGEIMTIPGDIDEYEESMPWLPPPSLQKILYPISTACTKVRAVFILRNIFSRAMREVIINSLQVLKGGVWITY